MAIAVIGWLLRKEAICLIGNLLFISAMLLLFMYRQDRFLKEKQLFRNGVDVGLSASGVTVIGILLCWQDALFLLPEWQKKSMKKNDKAAEWFRRRFSVKVPSNSYSFLSSIQPILPAPSIRKKKRFQTSVPIVEILLFTY